MREQVILAVHPHETDEQLVELLRKATLGVLDNGIIYELTMSGFDNNPIPLWALEDAQKFSVRLVALGFLSPLKLIPDIRARLIKRGWTAYELWLSSRNELGPDMDIQRMFDDCKGEFMRDVVKANEICDKLVGR